MYKTVGTGSSFGGNPTRQEIGLGNAESIESATIIWPTSKTTQVFKSVELNKSFRIHEYATSPEHIQYPKLKQQGNPVHTHQR
ncbi:ASPIC/UnbV domain-containing protein [Pelagicoccus mobilis]|uniref:ASPIC/UnbV domain-containing protein n=1 Tax=Pelagicoccus mobilis TaxID=415221 RepID=A0A934VPE7_9BACT|nr:ASPIC/UnbV domain-containing protein [Pelagicoccus mobilis]